MEQKAWAELNRRTRQVRIRRPLHWIIYYNKTNKNAKIVNDSPYVNLEFKFKENTREIDNGISKRNRLENLIYATWINHTYEIIFTSIFTHRSSVWLCTLIVVIMTASPMKSLMLIQINLEVQITTHKKTNCKNWFAMAQIRIWRDDECGAHNLSPFKGPRSRHGIIYVRNDSGQMTIEISAITAPLKIRI